MSGDDRDRYVREVTAVAAPDARLLLMEFTPDGSDVVPGVDQAEIERRFAADWTLLSTGDEQNPANRGSGGLRHYVLQRAR